MRKISKDLTDVPSSLLVDDVLTTHKRRKELIAKGSYIDEPEFNSRYKYNDVLIKLKSLYCNKCAYCEAKVEQGHVEHYRPKFSYYWLAYSWDNLLYCCPTCNQFKGSHFGISGTMPDPPKPTDDLSDINVWSSQIYDGQEKPKLLNPERDELDGVFIFDIQGHIQDNNNIRADYTIKTCHLDRDFLVDERRKIVDDFRNELSAELLNTKSKEDQKTIISSFVNVFIVRSKDEKNTFTAYRKNAVAWLDDIVKAIL